MNGSAGQKQYILLVVSHLGEICNHLLQLVDYVLMMSHDQDLLSNGKAKLIQTCRIQASISARE